MKIFVPGRLCLFGEHTDWAATYRRLNPDLEQGYTLLVGTNQGIYADVKPHSNELIVHSYLLDGSRQTLTLPMERAALLNEARKGNFFSYAAGVAYQFLTHYQVGGLEINNYQTDLPVGKGLASSAAICVLVARAFNRLYNLKMTVRGEMEFAYLGEITTPSRCGRMDQACAYGDRPILMIFDGDRMEVLELQVPQDLYFVIVDLGASKNTQEILSHLNHCYPFPTNEIYRNVQKYLGAISSQITQEAVAAIERGNAAEIGELMKRAQAEFDKHLIPACPSQLRAPILHQLLNEQAIQPYILGGKGVGSQGDGTAQFIVKNEECQQKLIEVIHRKFPQMQGLKLVIPKQEQDLSTARPNLDLPLEILPKNSNAIAEKRKIRKAVIPAAGFGTRLFPATKAVKKELFPIIDREGRVKPVILSIVEEVMSAGIEEIAIIVQKGDRSLFENFFKTFPSPDFFQKLSPQNQEYSEYIQDLGNRITILTQDTQEGYGHAVFGAKQWVNDEPFLLSLGDHVYASDTEISCCSQIINIYEQANQSVLGLTIMPIEMIQKAGCVTGFWQEPNSVLSVTRVCEKPAIDYARQYLSVEGMPADKFLCIFGLYVLTPQIFDYLEAHIRNNIREKGEFQLTSCLEQLRQDRGMLGYVVKGQCFDTGMPDAYRQAMIDFRSR